MFFDIDDAQHGELAKPLSIQVLFVIFSFFFSFSFQEECEALCTRIGIMVGGALRCLGTAQHLRTKYGHGFQIEIGILLPSVDEVSEVIAGMIASACSKELVLTSDSILNKDQLLIVFGVFGKVEWTARLMDASTASDLTAALSHSGGVNIRQFAGDKFGCCYCLLHFLSCLLLVCSVWWIFESRFDGIAIFLSTTFGEFVVRERQTSKIRVEIDATELVDVGNPEGPRVKRRLAKLFGAIESRKQELFIQEYSLSQTSLEQIFNQFASQVRLFRSNGFV